MEGLAIHWSGRSFSQNMYFYLMITNTYLSFEKNLKYLNFIYLKLKKWNENHLFPKNSIPGALKFCFQQWMSLFRSDIISILVSNYIGHCCVLICPIICSITKMCATHLSCGCGPFFNLNLNANSLRTPFWVPNWLRIVSASLIHNPPCSLFFLPSKNHVRIIPNSVKSATNHGACPMHTFPRSVVLKFAQFCKFLLVCEPCSVGWGDLLRSVPLSCWDILNLTFFRLDFHQLLIKIS